MFRGASVAASEEVSGRRRTPLGQSMRRMARRGALAIADTIVPPACLLCRQRLGSYDALCAGCWSQVNFIRPPLCSRLGIPMPFDPGGMIVSGAALKDPPIYDRARAVARFDSVMRHLIHSFKYGGRHDARRLFGRWLQEAGAELLHDADIIIPVPLHRWRLIHRRFNQAAMLALEVSRACGIPCALNMLERSRATRSQVGLTQPERRRNLSGAFQVSARGREGERGRNVVLMDDVITTGSTVSACARVLKRAGAARVDVLALALVTDESRINP